MVKEKIKKVGTLGGLLENKNLEEAEKMGILKTKIKKVKKGKLPEKFCFSCGDDTRDYIVYQNGFLCDSCQQLDKFKETK